MRKADQEIRQSAQAKTILERLVGPGATAGELMLTYSFASCAAIATGAAAFFLQWDWTVLQLCVAVVLAFDIAGGIVTNSTAAGRRWFHRPDRSERHHFQFVAMHGVHLALAAIAFFPHANSYAIAGYAYIIACAAVQLSCPSYLRRPVASVQTAVGLLLSLYLLDSPPHLDWLLPGLVLKLIFCYMPGETITAVQ